MASQWLHRGLMGLALTAFAACTDHLPTPPRALETEGPSFAAGGGNPRRYPVLRRTETMSADEIVSDWVQPDRNNWQSFHLPTSGTTVSFGPHAVAAPLYVTLIAKRGKLVAYEFLPHGTIFNAPVRVTQDLKPTEAYGNAPLMSTMVAGYLNRGTADISSTDGTANFAELFDVYYFDGTTDYTKTNPSSVRFYTTHFSGYSLASGRTTIRIAIDPYE